VTARPLTDVGSPVQRLVATSYPIRQRHRDRSCGPRTAVRQMPPDGAMVFIWEYRGPGHDELRRAPVRPPHFALTRRMLGDYECMGRSYLVLFRDGGRLLQAHVYLGRRAGAATQRRALEVLDSLRLGPAPPELAAVWFPPSRVLARTPYLGVACPEPNHFACDRVGLAVWLRAPALGVTATVDGRRLALDDPQWSGPAHDGRRRLFAGFLHPAGLLRGPLALRADDGPGRWIGRRAKRAGVGLWIADRPGHDVRTSVVVHLAAGWG
jgi:hypothetical protein